MIIMKNCKGKGKKVSTPIKADLAHFRLFLKIPYTYSLRMYKNNCKIIKKIMK
jgi:hypothetical protein